MKIIPILLLSVISTTVLATGNHHHKHKPIIIKKTIDNTKTIVVKKTEVIDKTKTIKQTIDNTVTNDYYNTIDNTVTEQYYNTIDNSVTSNVANPFDDNRLTAGIAMAGVRYPTPYRSDKNTFVSVAANFYRNAEAFGIGVTHLPTKDMALTIDYRFSGENQTDGMFGAGASFGF